MASLVRVGDPTNHGGTVTGPGVPLVTISGMPAAVLGDMHTCPMVWPGGAPHAATPFPAGNPLITIGGKPALTTDSICICGAQPLPVNPLVTAG